LYHIDIYIKVEKTPESQQCQAKRSAKFFCEAEAQIFNRIMFYTHEYVQASA